MALYQTMRLAAEGGVFPIGSTTTPVRVLADHIGDTPEDVEAIELAYAVLYDPPDAWTGGAVHRRLVRNGEITDVMRLDGFGRPDIVLRDAAVDAMLRRFRSREATAFLDGSNARTL